MLCRPRRIGLGRARRCKGGGRRNDMTLRTVCQLLRIHGRQINSTVSPWATAASVRIIYGGAVPAHCAIRPRYNAFRGSYGVWRTRPLLQRAKARAGVTPRPHPQGGPYPARHTPPDEAPRRPLFFRLFFDDAPQPPFSWRRPPREILVPLA